LFAPAFVALLGPLSFFALRVRAEFEEPAPDALGPDEPGLGALGLTVAGRPAIGPAFGSLDVSVGPFAAGALVLFFCAHGGRLGSSCAFAGVIIMQNITHAQSAAKAGRRIAVVGSGFSRDRRNRFRKRTRRGVISKKFLCP
jgi:hypothetical protein